MDFPLLYISLARVVLCMQLVQVLHLIVNICTMTAITATLASIVPHHVATAHHTTAGAVHLHHAGTAVRVVGRRGIMLIAIVAGSKGSLIMVIPVVVIRHHGGTHIGSMTTDQGIIIRFCELVVALHLFHRI